MALSRLKSLSISSLVAAWMLASLAPGILANFSVGARMVVTSARHGEDAAAVTLAILRGQLCGMTSAAGQTRDRGAEEKPARESSGAKVVLCLEVTEETAGEPCLPDRFDRATNRFAELRNQRPPRPPPRAV